MSKAAHLGCCTEWASKHQGCPRTLGVSGAMRALSGRPYERNPPGAYGPTVMSVLQSLSYCFLPVLKSVATLLSISENRF